MMALVGLTTSAQFKAQTSVNPQTKSKVVNKSQSQRSFQAVAPRADVAVKSYLNVNEKLVSKAANIESIAHLMQSSVAAMSVAQDNATTDLVESYNARGIDYQTKTTVDWVTQNITLTDDSVETHVFVNFVPTPSSLSTVISNGIIVEFEQQGNTITVKPQVLAQGGGIYLILSSAVSADGSIVLTKDGYDLKTIDDETILIGAWTTSEFDPTLETYKGYYQMTDGLSYRSTDAPSAAPKDVAFEPNELVLFAGLGLSGYGYNDNLAITGAYAPITFHNATTDVATSFVWSAKETDSNGVIKTTTTTLYDPVLEKDFTINTKGGAVYEDFSLIAYNGDAVSDPYTWGAGHTKRDDGTNRYEAIHVYAGEGASSFEFTDGTFATMTRQNQDGDLTFYTNWATPDKASNSMSIIYSYQGKPSTPLYLTGVTLPMVGFTADSDFNLHVKLYKCERSAAGKLTLGDVIAEGDATIDNVNDQFAATSGLTAVEFSELYVEDEDGMTETVDYLFVEDEFVVAIEGWDNGTFSGVLGSQDIDLGQRTSTWFEMTGEEGSKYSYTSWFPQLFIGLIDATYGYLYTTDDTNISFDKNAGTSTIHVEPRYYDLNEDGKPAYWLEVESVTVDGEEADDIPEWLAIEVANEDYTTATDEDGYEYFVNGIDYDLVFTAEELPADVEKRSCQIVFMQKGARLTVTVTQDTTTGINSVESTTSLNNRQAFNIAGQRVAKDYKGLVIKNGKKYLVK